MSLRQAINEKCKDCVYDEANGGTWRQQTEQCLVQSCPLYPHRPITTKSSSENSCISQEKREQLAKARAARRV